ncbi:uncharacterized protein LOC102713639 [Oryza brachyantha]|uniref:KIB1-4 beta-propeller domain-containing protein n=1 Tax=Oryza brachyantha TaxID=4533 RepID=J3M991_ORYBR|nr:uncharacterized protein LOC102713639 [Oryza brachyantha]
MPFAAESQPDNLHPPLPSQMADQFRPWQFIPDDILDLVVRRIPCEVDRLHAGRACRSWRLGLVNHKPPAPPLPLPWLLLPETEADRDGPTFCCVLSGWRAHPFFLPHAARSARYFGSYDGVWLFLAVDGQGYRAHDHVLVNLHKFQFLDLPNVVRIDLRFPQVLMDIEIAIVAVTLSRQPTEQGCIAAGIIELEPFPGPAGVRVIAFWRMGDRVILPFYDDVCPEGVEDVIYHEGLFLFLTPDEDIRACGEPVFLEASVHVGSILFHVEPRGDDAGETVLARYLFRSRGWVLMVVRLSSALHYLPTSSFRVFEFVIHSSSTGVCVNTWNKLEKLDGRMLFVGRGCSRSYDAGDGYPGMEEGVYFLDDGSFHEPVFHHFPFPASAHAAYRCCDNGKWSEASSQVERCFPERGPSKHSPPVWILP